MVKVTLELPARVMVRTVAGKPVNWDIESTPANVLAKILETGGRVILTNAFNGGGKDATDAEKAAALDKKLAAWASGEFAVVERGESQLGAMREAWLDDFRAQTGCTIKQADTFLADKVHAVLGKESKATFGNYLDATATELVKAGDFDNALNAREALEAHYAKLADDAEKAREKAKGKIEAPKLDLSAFKKASK